MDDALQHVEVHGEKIRQLETRVNKIDEILEKVRNRLPLWATVVFSMLVGIIGWLLKGVAG